MLWSVYIIANKGKHLNRAKIIMQYFQSKKLEFKRNGITFNVGTKYALNSTIYNLLNYPT